MPVTSNSLNEPAHTMSSAIVVRRYKCKEDRMELKRFTNHEALLQISGLPSTEMLRLSQQMSSLGYRIACNCENCISYKEETRTGGLPSSEPLVKGLGVAFNSLASFNYQLKSTSTTQNEDGSSTTMWVWVKEKTISFI